MPQPLDKMNWPIALMQKHSNDIIKLDSTTDWLEQTAMLGPLTGSALLDYNGNSYVIEHEDPLQLQLTIPQLTIEYLSTAIQQHASQQGYCCTSKLKLRNIKQFFDNLTYIEDEY